MRWEESKSRFLVMGILLLTLGGCGVREEVQVLNEELSQLTASRARLLARRQGFQNEGVWVADSGCVLIERGAEPAFACGNPHDKASVATAVCGSTGVQLCRNLVAEQINKSNPEWGGTINALARFFREVADISPCRDAVQEAVFLTSGQNFNVDRLLTFAQSALEDDYAQEALNKCKGILCKDGKLDETSKDVNAVLLKIAESAASCMIHTMQACGERFDDWTTRPARLREQCSQVLDELTTVTSRLALVMYEKTELEKSLRYRIWALWNS